MGVIIFWPMIVLKLEFLLQEAINVAAKDWGLQCLRYEISESLLVSLLSLMYELHLLVLEILIVHWPLFDQGIYLHLVECGWLWRCRQKPSVKRELKFWNRKVVLSFLYFNSRCGQVIHRMLMGIADLFLSIRKSYVFLLVDSFAIFNRRKAGPY